MDKFDMRRFCLEEEIREINLLEEGGFDLEDKPAYVRDAILGDKKGRYSYAERRQICKKKLAELNKRGKKS